MNAGVEPGGSLVHILAPQGTRGKKRRTSSQIKNGQGPYMSQKVEGGEES